MTTEHSIVVMSCTEQLGSVLTHHFLKMPKQKRFNQLSRKAKGFRGTPYHLKSKETTLQSSSVLEQADTTSSQNEPAHVETPGESPQPRLVNVEESPAPVVHMEESNAPAVHLQESPTPPVHVEETPAPPVHVEGSSVSVTPVSVPMETATSKKFAISSHLLSPGEPSSSLAASEDSFAGKGFRIISYEALAGAIEGLLCPKCSCPVVFQETLGARKGLVSKLVISCTSSACQEKARVIQDPKSAEDAALNIRAILGMRAIGRGRSGMDAFCGMMDMLPPLTVSPYKEQNKLISSMALKEAKKNMSAASAHLHSLHDIQPEQLLDCSITCDGTWSKRGYTATHGIVVVISWETGQVLDFEVLTKRCTICAQRDTTMEEEEFGHWMEKHAPNCTANHDGSSPAMEMAGAEAIFKRSVEKLHLRYTTVISDGDSKTISHLNDKVKPYGDVNIIKHECVGHIQKRVRTRLESAKKVQVLHHIHLYLIFSCIF